MKLLLVHPSSLITRRSFAAGAAGAGADRGGVPACGARRAVARPAGLPTARLLSDARRLAARCGRYSLNYLANIPEVVDLAIQTRERLPDGVLFARRACRDFTRVRFSTLPAGRSTESPRQPLSRLDRQIYHLGMLAR